MMKKNQIFWMSSVLIALLFSACNTKTASESNENVKHYRHLQFSESPFDLENGLHELTPEQAKTINNYRFTYDDSARLIEVAYVRDTVLLNYNSMRGAARITYTYEGNQQIRHYFNEKNESIDSWGAFAAVFTLNDEGGRTALHFTNQAGEPVENRNNIYRFEWSILDNGWLKEHRYNLAGEEVIMNPFCPFYELRFEYDANGYLTRMMNYQGDTLYNCTAENCGDIGVSHFEFTNTPKGDLLSFSVHNTTGQLSNLYWGWAKRINTVDENGYVTETAVFDQDDEYHSGQNVPVFKTIYDEHGAAIEAHNLDASRNLMNNPSNGVAITQYTYDDMGLRVETLQFDKDRNPVVKE
jgi:hypothetical protein